VLHAVSILIIAPWCGQTETHKITDADDRYTEGTTIGSSN